MISLNVEAAVTRGILKKCVNERRRRVSFLLASNTRKEGLTAMGKLSTESQGTSRVAWDHLEGWVRGKVQELIQTLLEEEVTELLGRNKSARRQAVDPDVSGPG